MTSVEELWQQRLTEARVRCGRGLDPERLAERYEVATAEEIRQLTNQGVKEVVRGGHAVLTLDDLDAAAEKLEEATEEILTDGGVDQSSPDTGRSLHERYEPEAPVHRAVNVTSRALKDRCGVIEHDEYDLYRGKDPETGVESDQWWQERQRAIEDVAHDVEMDTCHVNECLNYLGEDSDRLYCDGHNPDEYIECAEEECDYPTSHTETDYCSTHTWYNGRSVDTDTDHSGGESA